MRLLEHLLGPLAEISDVAFAADRKSSDPQTIYPVEPGVKLVAPCNVVGRAGREHLDLGVSSEMFRDIPGMQLRATVQVGAIALDDDGKPHCSSVPVSPSGDGCATVSVAGAAAGAGASLGPGVGGARADLGDPVSATCGSAAGVGGSGSPDGAVDPVSAAGVGNAASTEVAVEVDGLVSGGLADGSSSGAGGGVAAGVCAGSVF
tara:strand:+ start:857 stop:1471 length:615 start_codon:yes stop_codon:yes gene_type:complete